MYRVDPQVARLPLRARRPPLGDRDPGRVRGVLAAHPPQVGQALPQVVQMPVRQPGQAPEALVAEDLPARLRMASVAGPDSVPCNSSVSASSRMSARSYLRRNGLGRAPAPVRQFPVGQIAGDQPRQLRPRQPRCAHQIAAHQALVRPLQPPIREPPQHPSDMRVGPLPLRHQDRFVRVAREKPAQIVQARMSLQIEMQDHPPMIPTPPGEPLPGSFLVGITPRFRLISRWKRLLVTRVNLSPATAPAAGGTACGGGTGWPSRRGRQSPARPPWRGAGKSMRPALCRLRKAFWQLATCGWPRTVHETELPATRAGRTRSGWCRQPASAAPAGSPRPLSARGSPQCNVGRACFRHATTTLQLSSARSGAWAARALSDCGIPAQAVSASRSPALQPREPTA